MSVKQTPETSHLTVHSDSAAVKCFVLACSAEWELAPASGALKCVLFASVCDCVESIL